MAPVYVAQRNDLSFAKDITEKFETLNKAHDKTVEELKVLKRGYGQFSEINKKIQKMEQSTQNTLGVFDGNLQNCQSQLE